MIKKKIIYIFIYFQLITCLMILTLSVELPRIRNGGLSGK